MEKASGSTAKVSSKIDKELEKQLTNNVLPFP